MLSFLSRHIFAASRAAAMARPEAETMEPRLLYSADLMPAGLDGELATLAPEVRTLDDDAAAWLAPANEISRPSGIVFIDAAVEDSETLLAGLRRDTPSLEVIHLNADRDGVEQISEALAGRHGLEAIHIISHGAAGQLQLSNSTLDADALEARAQTIAAWSTALTDTADILLYGCDVAGNANGVAFVAALARLIGADVAANEDRTGAQAAGGDWTLEHHAGRIEASAIAASNWIGTLAITSTSGDIDINTTEFKNQYAPSVAVFDDGGWVAAWQDFERGNIYARIFNADGSQRVAEFRINADTNGEASLPGVATDGVSRFVVTFTNTASGNQDVFARIFDLNGVPHPGGDILVNAGETSGDQTRSSVAMNAAGAFVVAWDGNGTGDSSGIYARRFGTTGVPVDAVFRVNQTTSGKQEKADVAMGGDGRFVVVWRDDQSGTRIDARLYDSEGNAADVATVSSGAAAERDDPAVAMDAAGTYAVVWAAKVTSVFPFPAGPSAVYLQRFHDSGSVNGSFENVSFEFLYDQSDPEIAMSRAGDFVVSWTTLNKDGGGDGVYLRANTSGNWAGPATVVNAYTSGDQHASAIAMNAFGHVVTVWDGRRNAGSMSDINGRTFFLPEASASNTAPVLATLPSPSLDSFDEDLPGNGTLVSALVSLGVNVSDADAGAVTGIALLSVDDSNGVWHFSSNGGDAWTAINAAALAGNNALLLAAESQTRLRFTPNAHFNGTLNPVLTFRAWDRTSGSNGSFGDTTANGGTTAFSEAPDTATLTINPVNDLPSITRNQLTIGEGHTVTFGTAQLDASDVESGAGSLTYTVSSVSAGFFAQAGMPGVAITSFTQQQIDTGSTIVFVHDGSEAAPAYTLALTDGDGGSSPASAATITFTNINDAPQLADGSPTISALQNNGTSVGAVGVRINALVSVAGSGSGLQNVTDPDSGAVAGIAITAADESRGHWHFSIDDGVNWAQLDLDKLSAGEARLLAADNNTRIYFHETTGGGSTTIANGLTFRAWDGTTGNNGGSAIPIPGGGSRAFSNDMDTVELVVASSNTRPTLDNTIAFVVEPYEDDPAPAGAAGFAISDVAILSGPAKNVTDTDPGAKTGIAVVGATGTNGKWWYSTNGGSNWTRIDDTLSDNSALLLANDGFSRLYYQPTTTNHFGDTDGVITFKAWDQTSGVNGAFVNSTVGNSISFDSTTVTANIQPVNDAPIVTVNSLTISEGGRVTLTELTNFNSSDVEEGDRSKLVFTIGLVTGGVFFNIDTASDVTSFTQADIDNRRIQFRHDGNEAAPAYTFKVSDAGLAESASVAGNVTFTNVNDAPVLTLTGSASYSLDEDAGVPIGAVGAPVSALVSLDGSGSGPENVSDPDAAGLTGIAITYADAINGIWYWSLDNGTIWNPLGDVSDKKARLLTAEPGMRIAFAPNVSYNGTTPALRFKAWDRSAWANGAQQDTMVGNAFSSASDTLTLTVRAANDAPTVVTVDLGSIAEDGNRTITLAELLAGANDVDGDTLSVRNVALAAGSGGVVDNGDSTWTFTPTPDWNGNAIFSFDVTDGPTLVANTANLMVAAGHDAPTVVAVDLGSMVEDGSRLITQAQLLAGASDIDGDTLSVSNLLITAGTGAIANNGNGAWTYTPGADWSGNTGFSFVVGDGTTTVTNTASLLVTAVNDAPTVSAPARQTILAGEGAGPLNVTIGDVDSPLGTLTVSARSSNPAVLPDSAILLSGTGAQRSLSISASHAGNVGTAQIIIEVSDGSAVGSARITIDAVSSIDPPSITPVTPAPAEAVVIEAETDAQDTAPTSATAAPEPARAITPNADNTEDGLGIAEADTLSFAPPPTDEVLRITLNSSNETSDSRALPIRLSDADILSLSYRGEASTAQLSSSGRVGDAIREAYITRTFDTLRDSANDETDALQQRIGVTMVTGAGLTVGYVAWLIRGGVLLTSLLTTMPAWRFLDPLPVLGGVKGDEEGEDDSLEALVAGDAADDEFDRSADPDNTSHTPGAQT